jgi:SpoVK/Ycf46/Vps4 family AAA+-type ATPase
MLTNFLLTRIESHPGIVVLTSNNRMRIDYAFIRRLDAIVEFPLPGAAERLSLWKTHLGGRSPGDDVCRYLANHCELPGGAVRNAVLTAASAAPDGAIPFRLLLSAIEREYRKLGRAVPPRFSAAKE